MSCCNKGGPARCQRHHDHLIALKMHWGLFQNGERASLELSAFQRASLLPTSQGPNVPSPLVTLHIQTVRNVRTINATLTLAEWPSNCGTEQPHYTLQLILACTSCIWHPSFLWFVSLSINFCTIDRMQSSFLLPASSPLMPNGHKLLWKSWKFNLKILLSK